jgi:hypothetical protein
MNISVWPTRQSERAAQPQVARSGPANDVLAAVLGVPEYFISLCFYR